MLTLFLFSINILKNSNLFVVCMNKNLQELINIKYETEKYENISDLYMHAICKKSI